MIAIAAPDVRNLVSAMPESFVEYLVLPLPGLPDRSGTIGRFKRSLYGVVFRFTRYVAHVLLQCNFIADQRPKAFEYLQHPAINQRSPSTAQAAPEALAR